MKKQITKVPLTALDILIDILKEFEGCRLTAYFCPAGVCTIGYGHTGPDVYPGLKWSQQQADEALHNQAIESLNEAVLLSPSLATAGMEKHAAIADFIYNIGSAKYSTSTLKKLIDSRQWHAASEEIKKWHHANGKDLKGLIKRRERESSLLIN